MPWITGSLIAGLKEIWPYLLSTGTRGHNLFWIENQEEEEVDIWQVATVCIRGILFQPHVSNRN